MKNIQIQKSFRITEGCFSIDISGIFNFFTGDFYYTTESGEFHKNIYFKNLKIVKDERQTVFFFSGSNDFIIIEKDFVRFHFNEISLTVTDKEKIKMINKILCEISSETEKNIIYSIIQSHRERYTDLTGVLRYSSSELTKELQENGVSDKEIKKIQEEYF